MLDWNVIVTVRHDFVRALRLLRGLGAIERTGLYNVIAMRVADVHALLEQLAHAPPQARLFDSISHVVPVTRKIAFATVDELEARARDVVLGWAPELAGRRVLVRLRRRGHKGALHALELEQRLGLALLEELARRGAPGRWALDDPDAVIAIEMLGKEAGLALWTRADLDRYPFLRASIERPPRAHAPPASAVPPAPSPGQA